GGSLDVSPLAIICCTFSTSNVVTLPVVITSAIFSVILSGSLDSRRISRVVQPQVSCQPCLVFLVGSARRSIHWLDSCCFCSGVKGDPGAGPIMRSIER